MSWIGTSEGRARKSVCCVGVKVRVFVMYCGNVLHIEPEFAGIPWSKILNSSNKALFVLGSELSEEHFESFTGSS